MLSRRTLLPFAIAALTAGSAAASPEVLPDDMSMGSPTARIQVIEYASMACPHCGHFNETIIPTLKAKYIDTGKVRYTLKEMLTEPATVAAAGFLVARCAGPSKYFAVVDQVFRSQPRWTSGNIKPIFKEIAAANGVDDAHFDACLQDQAAVDAITARAVRASEKDGVNSTPTLFINGRKIDDLPQTPEDLDRLMAAAAKAPTAKPAVNKPADKKGGR
jgi:protein-disulfide isomerase